MITYAVEKINEEFKKEITPIFETHRKELQSYSDMRLNVDWDVYEDIEAKGNLLTLVARDEGRIVGYAAFIININMHYSDFKYAMQDVFYVVEDKRGGRIAVKLLKMSEELLKDRGVNVISHHAKPINKFASFLEKFDYKQTEIMLAKRID